MELDASSKELLAGQDFRHQPLSDPSSQFRLLQFQPYNGSDDEICCTLLTGHGYHYEGTFIGEVLWGSDIEYYAISYTWSNHARSHYIWVDSKKLRVTENCHDALWQARETRFCATVPIWIDSICINQDDNHEKTQQVRIMAHIYKSASATLVSLGPHSDDSRLFCQRLDYLVTESDFAETQKDENFKRAAAAIAAHPYRRRAWGIQELTSSNNAIFLCGNDTFHITSLDEWMEYRNSKLGMPDSEFFTWISQLLSARKTFQHYEKTQLQVLLTKFRDLKCSDPRDRVFSLLALQRDSRKLRPDYTLSRFALAKRVLSLEIEFQCDLLSGSPQVAFDAVLEALLLDLDDPTVRLGCAERERSIGQEAKARPCSIDEDFTVKVTQYTSLVFGLSKNKSNILKLQIPESTDGYFRPFYHAILPFAQPLYCADKMVGWASNTIMEGDFLLVHTMDQSPGRLVGHIELLCLVIRTTGELAQHFEIVGTALLAASGTLLDTEERGLQLYPTEGEFNLYFDSEDLIVFLAYSRAVRRASGANRQALLRRLFDLNVTRHSFSSYAEYVSSYSDCSVDGDSLTDWNEGFFDDSGNESC